MAGVLGGIGRSMTKFAQGVYSELGDDAAKSVLKKVNKEAMTDTQKVMFQGGKKIANAPMFSGIMDSARMYNNAKIAAKADPDKAMGVFKAIAEGHKTFTKDASGKMVGSYSAGKIAGTVGTVGVAGRLITGGGLYKDGNGNFNLPGIPFI